MSDATLFNAQSDVLKTAVLSPCGTYRYELTRSWGDGPRIGWVMLNPSTADAEIDDPTIRRCIGFAKAWGFEGIVVRNLYALRATNPKELWVHEDPVGPDNNAFLGDTLGDEFTVCAWGANAKPFRVQSVVGRLTATGAALRHLGLTKDGYPRHPLYLRGDVTPSPYPPVVPDGGAA